MVGTNGGLPSPSPTNSVDVLHQGWLIKSPPAKGIFKPRWRRRWFILRAGSYPNQYVLEYFTDESCRRVKGQINLDECEQLDLSANGNQQISAPASVQDRHKYTFNLITPNRVYYLACESEEDIKKWLGCLTTVCGLKTSQEEEARFVRGTDENNPPPHIIPREERHYENLESDESSPTLSSTSPYIPISECFTGKPISLTEPGYCNTSFPFPPKVNWATHPSKRESETTPSPRPIGLEAPPRPPKKKSPVYSPNDNDDLMGTYLQIDTNNLTTSNTVHDSSTIDGRSNSLKFSHPHHQLGPLPKKFNTKQPQTPEEPGVEYKMIDHVKTKALNQMRQERAEQLTRTNPISKLFMNNNSK